MDYFLQIYFTFFFTFMRFYLFGNPKADAFKNDRSIANRGKNINDINYTIEEVNNLKLTYLENHWNWLFCCCINNNCSNNSSITIMAL